MNSHKVLVIGLGNIPLDDNQIVEGGGLRAWGLAYALSTKHFSVRLLIPGAYLTSEKKVNEYLSVIPYGSTTDLASEISKSSVVIYPAGAPHISSLCIANKDSSTILIADAYVPIHVEVASRQFHDKMQSEEIDFNSMSPYWLNAITSADAILCASQEQQAYYLGILSATGYLRPSSYQNIRILVVPFGYFPNTEVKISYVDNNLIRQPSTLRILWYGGFYPWFDTSKFMDVLSNLDQLISEDKNKDYQVRVIGAENPFIEDENFKSHTNKQIANLKRNKHVTFSPWLPFNQRFKAFQDIDIVICLTSEGYENTLAWRTRYLDFIEYSVPLLTNSSDPLSTRIVQNNCGWKIDSSDSDDLALKLRDIILDRESLINARASYQTFKQQLTWDKSVLPLEKLLKERPSIILQNSINLSRENANLLDFSQKPSTRQLIKFGISQLRIRGFRHTLVRTQRFVKSSIQNKRIRSKTGQIPKNKRALIFMHQLDFSGSPLIGSGLALELKSRMSSLQLDRIEIYCFGKVEQELANELTDVGIHLYRVEKHHSPKIHQSDLVIVNGLAQPEALILEILRASSLTEIAPIFLVHEDRPLVHVSEKTLGKLGKALDSGLLKMVTPSVGTTDSLRLHTNSQLIETRPYPIKNIESLNLGFSKALSIHLTGSTHDFRKNQQLALILVALIKNRTQDDLVRFRQIHLSLLGVDEATAYGKFIAESAKSLKGFVSIYPPMAKKEVEKIVSKCNAVICVSEYEALPLFVSESMAKGQIVLRNNCSGHDEQVADLENGVLINLEDIDGAVDKIVSLLDRTLTTDEALETMGKTSRTMVQKQINSSFLDYLGWP